MAPVLLRNVLSALVWRIILLLHSLLAIALSLVVCTASFAEDAKVTAQMRPVQVMRTMPETALGATKAAKPAKQTKSGSDKSGKARKQVSRSRRTMLIPPPPPTIPTGLHLPFVTIAPVELMSEADLKRHREQLALDLTRASKDAEDQESAHKERGDRAVLFESLYKEGVVSRRELENAQREVRQGEGDLTDARLKVTDLERELARTDARLKYLAQNKAKKAIRIPKR